MIVRSQGTVLCPWLPHSCEGVLVKIQLFTFLSWWEVALEALSSAATLVPSLRNNIFVGMQ